MGLLVETVAFISNGNGSEPHANSRHGKGHRGRVKSYLISRLTTKLFRNENSAVLVNCSMEQNGLELDLHKYGTTDF